MTTVINKEEIQQNISKNLWGFAPIGIMVLDNGRIVSVNNHAVTLLGIGNPVKMEGKELDEFLASKTDKEKLHQLRSKVIGFGNKIDITFINAEGSNFEASCKLSTPNDADSDTEILFFDKVCLRDSEIKAKEELVRKTQELEQFSYIVSHDLKAPLRGISNIASWLAEDLGDSLSEENQHSLDLLQNRTQRLETMINGVLEYSRVGRIKVETESIDVYELVKELVELLSPPANITINISESLPFLEAPKTLLSQVFSNLIGNAIKYNDKEQGEINVDAESIPGFYKFTIKDNGPGIPEEHQEKIFKIFQTLQSRDTNESTGIGLTIVKKIVETMGGQIKVDSKVGESSTFTFTWPIQNS